MSIFFKARGTNSIGLLFIRLSVGIYTLSLGIMQANTLQDYVNRTKELGIFNENISFIIGFILPFVLIVFGSLYILGFFTPATSFILAVISFAKILTRGIFPSPGIPFNKDIIFLICFITTLFAGAGVISFDAFLDKKKKKVKVEEPKTATVTAEVITEPPKDKTPG
jgi:uncharacterized membrane protein YphA (DoxX/SURF4 family)